MQGYNWTKNVGTASNRLSYGLDLKLDSWPKYTQIHDTGDGISTLPRKTTLNFGPPDTQQG